MNSATFFTPNQLSFSIDNGRTRTVSGYAAVFHNAKDAGTEYEPEPGVKIRMGRNCFDGLLERPIAALWNHDWSEPLGSNEAGNLQLSTDHHGLKFSLTLPNTTRANDVWELVGGNGGPSIVRGCSFTALGKGEWSKEGNHDVLTFHNWNSLEEITITKNPAFKGTSVSWSDMARNYARQEQSKILVARYKKI